MPPTLLLAAPPQPNFQTFRHPWHGVIISKTAVDLIRLEAASTERNLCIYL